MLRVHERNYSTHDMELLAIIHALKKWRHYLLSQPFKLVTDHKSLKWIFSQTEINMQQQQWIEYLQEFNFKIIYKPRRENLAADALSMKVQILAISIISNPMLEEIQIALSQDPYFGGIISSYPN